MKELSLKEIQQTELGILKKFDEICRNNDLEYSLAYGTMIGAVRHHGFIPWDDDIDVIMKRDDYEKLLKLQYKDDRYEIKSYRYSDNYYYIYSKMIDRSTHIEESLRTEKNMGVFIDIFPLDYVNLKDEICNSISDDKRKIQDSIRFDRLVTLRMGSSVKSYFPLTLKSLPKALFVIFTMLFRKRILAHYDKKFLNNKREKYLIEFFSGIVYEIDWCNETVLIEFEDSSFPCYKNYNAILTQIYGDYMQLPPEEQRVPIHFTKALIEEENA